MGVSVFFVLFYKANHAQVAALKGYENATTKALTSWEAVYPPESGNNVYISLTDTFSSSVFFKEIKQTPDLLERWSLRQDSGDPMIYIKAAKQLYEDMGIDPTDKPIVFSDSLNIEKAIAIQNACKDAGLQGEDISESIDRRFLN
jgi:nicotinate phosphoribosyltransferase